MDFERMITMRFPRFRRFAPALAFMAVVSPLLAQDRSDAAIFRDLEAAISRKEVPGIVVMAGNRSGVLLSGARGADGSQAMRADGIFQVASMLKAIEAIALMQQVEAGRVALDDSAAKYLPELAHPMVFTSFDSATGAYQVRPAAGPITVRHLLTHTSGLGFGFTSAIVRDFKPKAGDHFGVGPLLFDPGTDWHYGTSYDWVGRLVEALSGQKLDDYLQARIFGPLRMVDTGLSVPPEKLPRLVSVYRHLADGTFQANPRGTGARNGLYSTAADYLRFVRMVLNEGTLDGARILAPATIAQMERNQIGAVRVPAIKSALPASSADFTFINDRRDQWGLGFLITAEQVPGKRAVGSLSWGGIDNTYYWIDPKNDVAGVILMQFSPFADPSALAVYDVFERGVYRLIGR